MLAYDLAPLRPWEYWQVDAEEWTEAVQMQNAYQEGIREARDEQKAKDATDKLIQAQS